MSLENLSWDGFLLELDRNLSYTEREKALYGIAFQTLRKHLGEDFLLFENIASHYLAPKLINYAGWTRIWLAWFAQCLDSLVGATGYPKVIQDFKKPKLAYEKFQLLRNAHRFKQQGFQITFEPTLITDRGPKSPDLHLLDRTSGDEIFVEISSLNPSIQYDAAFGTSMQMLKLLAHQNEVDYFGILYTDLSKNTLNELGNQIRGSIEKAKSETGLIELASLGKYYIAIANLGNKQFEEAAKIHGMRRNSIAGPPGHADEIHRIKTKIRDKMNQLREDRNNILILYNNALNLSRSSDLTLLASLDECIRDLPSLFSCAFITENLAFNQNARNEPLESGKLFSFCLDGDEYDQGYLSQNKFFKNTLSTDVRDRLIKAF